MSPDNPNPTTARAQALSDALTVYAPKGMESGVEDIAYLVREMIEWENATGNEVEREQVAHNMWTMGAKLKHKGCVADNEASYENVCAPCQTYLEAVADSILLRLAVVSSPPEPTNDEEASATDVVIGWDDGHGLMCAVWSGRFRSWQVSGSDELYDNLDAIKARFKGSDSWAVWKPVLSSVEATTPSEGDKK